MLINEGGTCSLTIKTEGAWSCTIEPISVNTAVHLSGTGSYASDIYNLSEPSTVTLSCTIDPEYSWAQVDVILYYKDGDRDGWFSDTLISESLYSFEFPYTNVLILIEFIFYYLSNEIPSHQRGYNYENALSDAIKKLNYRFQEKQLGVRILKWTANSDRQ